MQTSFPHVAPTFPPLRSRLFRMDVKRPKTKDYPSPASSSPSKTDSTRLISPIARPPARVSQASVLDTQYVLRLPPGKMEMERTGRGMKAVPKCKCALRRAARAPVCHHRCAIHVKNRIEYLLLSHDREQYSHSSPCGVEGRDQFSFFFFFFFLLLLLLFIIASSGLTDDMMIR